MATHTDISMLVDWLERRFGWAAHRDALEREYFAALSTMTPEQLRRGCENLTHVGVLTIPSGIGFREFCDCKEKPATLTQAQQHLERMRSRLAAIPPTEPRRRSAA